MRLTCGCNADVDVYGSCGPLQCPRYLSADKCNKKLRNDYHFYLSFENSHCRDYITEKLFWNALLWVTSHHHPHHHHHWTNKTIPEVEFLNRACESTDWREFKINRNISMVGSTKVLCAENMFSRKSQRYKGRMFHYMDIRLLCIQYQHYLWLFIDKVTVIPVTKQNVTFHPITGNKYSTLLCHKEVKCRTRN